MRVVSWNVNGIRSAEKKGFADYLDATDAHVVALQETRAEPAQIAPALRERDGWHTHFVAAQKKGYSGVGLFARSPVADVVTELGRADFDSEGRLQIARIGALTLVNCYFPNGSGTNRDNSRIPFKLDFYRALFDRLEPIRSAGDPIVVVGDFNTAHREIDLARPRENTATSGFCPEEREELDRWLRSGWVDTFRAFEPGPGHYTWWSQRFGVREKNIGWRIDYALASDATMRWVRGAAIHPDVPGSDHCPISIDLDPALAR